MVSRIYEILAICCLTVIVSCSSGSNYIEIVKNGIMKGYPSTTIGKAFDATFDKAKWKFLETEKGAKIVEFSGAITKKIHDDFYSSLNDAKLTPGFGQGVVAMLALKILGTEKFTAIAKGSGKECSSSDTPCIEKQTQDIINTLEKDGIFKVGEQINFQWTISADGKYFEISSWSGETWNKLGTSLD